MKGNNLTLGIILIAVGILWMLSNMGFSTWFVWESLFKLWPLALVTIGIGLIFKGNRYVIALSWILLVAFIIGYGLWEYRDLKVRPSGNPEIIIESHPQTNRGTLNINLNAGNFKFDSINDKLMRAYIPDPYVLHNVDFEGNDETVIIDVKQTRKAKIPYREKAFDYNFSLNDNISWDIEIDTGAMNGVLDFSSLNLNRFDLDMGAGNIKIIFSNLSTSCDADINSGASNIELVIPENAGVRIVFEGFIKDSNLDELNWKKTGHYYVSPNYDTSDRKLDINLDTGVSKLNVTVY